MRERIGGPSTLQAIDGQRSEAPEPCAATPDGQGPGARQRRTDAPATGGTWGLPDNRRRVSRRQGHPRAISMKPGEGHRRGTRLRNWVQPQLSEVVLLGMLAAQWANLPPSRLGVAGRRPYLSSIPAIGGSCEADSGTERFHPRIARATPPACHLSPPPRDRPSFWLSCRPWCGREACR